MADDNAICYQNTWLVLLYENFLDWYYLFTRTYGRTYEVMLSLSLLPEMTAPL